MNIVRAYKLQQLGIQIKPFEKEVIEFIDQKFRDLKKVSLSNFPNGTFFFNKDNQCIFELTHDMWLYVRFENVWNCLINDYGMKNIEIKNIIKYWVKKEYGIININNYECDFDSEYISKDIEDEYIKNL